MSKKSALAALRKEFGQDEAFDPELFLLKLGRIIADGNQRLNAALVELQAQKGEADKILEKFVAIADLSKSIDSLVTIHQEIRETLKNRPIDKVEVEHIREVPPSKIKLEFPKQKNEHIPERQQRWWIAALSKLVKAPTDNLRAWFEETLSQIQKPEGAIAVRLTQAQKDEFYNSVAQLFAGGAVIPNPIGITSGKELLTAAISLDATGDVVTAVADKRIRVYAIKLNVTDPIAVKFRSDTTDLEGEQSYDSTGGYTESVDPPAFLLETQPGEALNLNIDGTGGARGRVSYFLDD